MKTEELFKTGMINWNLGNPKEAGKNFEKVLSLDLAALLANRLLDGLNGFVLQDDLVGRGLEDGFGFAGFG